jgi:hypothetical protein
MTNLPVVFSEAEVIEAVSQWIGEVQEKMTAGNSREWLEATLRDHLQRGLIETLNVIESADAGDEIADAALCRVYAEMRNRHEEPPVVLEAYALKALVRGPVTRGRGHLWYDNWRRDIGIAVLVYLAQRRFGLRPTRNREQRRRCEPSASSAVSAALGRHRINVSDKTVENISGRLQGQLEAFLLTAQI